MGLVTGEHLSSCHGYNNYLIARTVFTACCSYLHMGFFSGVPIMSCKNIKICPLMKNFQVIHRAFCNHGDVHCHREHSPCLLSEKMFERNFKTWSWQSSLSLSTIRKQVIDTYIFIASTRILFCLLFFCLPIRSFGRCTTRIFFLPQSLFFQFLGFFFSLQVFFIFFRLLK